MRIFDQISRGAWLNHFRDLRLRRFWKLSGVAIFLHTIADPISTYLAVVVYNVGHEVNPLLATPLNQSLSAFVAVHTPVWMISIGTIAGFVVLFEKSSIEDLEIVVRYGELVWSGLILWGVIVVGNNLYVLSLAFT